MQQPTSSPTRRGYLLALVVFLAGAIGSAVLVVFFILGILSLGDDLQRVVVPGSHELDLPDDGRYTIYYEYRSNLDGVDYRTSTELPPLEITIRSVETGEILPTSSSFGFTNYDLMDHAGESIRTFRIEEPGRYELTATYPGGQTSPDIVLAVGHGVERGILTSVGAMLGAGFLFCVAALAAFGIAGFTLYRRSQASRSKASGSSATY